MFSILKIIRCSDEMVHSAVEVNPSRILNFKRTIQTPNRTGLDFSKSQFPFSHLGHVLSVLKVISFCSLIEIVSICPTKYARAFSFFWS